MNVTPGLAGNREEGFRDGYRILLKIDHTTHLEDDNPAALHPDRCRKGTGTTRFQVRDADDLPSPSTGCVCRPTLSIRKRLDRIGQENSGEEERG